jgi:NADPH-dependent 2,4-dienoyl-CoA reductase/sulfur reductase-like enzyme
MKPRASRDATEPEERVRIVIIGNGVAGITCAMDARQRDADACITIISGETDYFFSRTALMYSFMDSMRRKDLEPYERHVYARKNLRLVRDWVVDLDAEQRLVTLEGGESIAWDRLVLALGAAPNLFPWDGVDAVDEGLVHFVSMQDLDHCERLVPSTKQAVVVGGGLIGIELVECLLHHGIATTFLIREPWFWPMSLGPEEAEFVVEHMRQHGADVRLEDEMERVEVDGQGRVSAVRTTKGEHLPCQMLGIAAGVHPNLERVKAWSQAPEMGRGIIVDQAFRTSLPDVFAIGDCAEIHPTDGTPYGETIWYSAKRHGHLVGAHALWGDDIAYTRPIFFNSSKFFEIEYTTVGEVMTAPEGTPTIWLKMPKKPVSIRIVHDGDQVIGFNMLGCRFNHELLERWIAERRSPAWVEQHLREAQFDVEFGRTKLKRMERSELPLRRMGR